MVNRITQFKPISHSIHSHSVRNDFTGFATAAFIAWKLTVINVIAMRPDPVTINIHQDGIIVLYSYCFNQPI